jgi:polysaccharide export outer membrane protein
MKWFVSICFFWTAIGEISFAQTTILANRDTKNYILRPSDLIQVDVFQEQDLRRQTRIEADGQVHLVLIKPFRIAGMTLSMAQKEIARRYYDEEFLWNPQVSVTVMEFSPRKVSVLGEVMRSGFVQIVPDRKLTFVEAISSAGGFTRQAQKKEVQLKRTVKNGSIEVYTFDAESIMREKGIKDIELLDGDIITVPDLRSKVNILGQVGRPGFVPIPADRKLTLVEAISAAGGFTRLANSGKVQLKRTDREGRVQSMEIDVKSIMKDSKTRDIELRDGDIIFVPERLT